MGRVVRVNEDLSGQTIDVSAFPDGHARESYLGQCDLRGATIIGDIRGTDLLRCQLEGADLSQTDTYGCQWTESTFDDATVFPDDPGAAQYQITYELIRRYIAVHCPVRLRRRMREIVAAHQARDYATFCELMARFKAVARDHEEALKLWRALPDRMQRRMQDVFTTCDGGPPRRTVTVGWPDGVRVELDRDNLPPLPRPSDRYELKLWIQEQAGPVAEDCGFTGLEGHYCFVHEIPDLRAAALGTPDAWLLERPNF